MTDAPMIELRHFSLGYDSPLLSDIDLTIYRGQRLALVGANGVGKTSLLRSLTMLETSWTGEILLGGRSVRKMSRRELARKIAYVQQLPTDFFLLTVRRLVELGRYPHQNPFAPANSDDRYAVERALERCGVARLANRSITTLSGGQRQRVLLAAALAQEPELLLLDEPQNFLDVRNRDETARLLDAVHRSGVTLLEVTHDLNRSALDRVRAVALADRRICFDGPVAEMMTGERLRQIFGLDLTLVPHPQTGDAMVLPGLF